MSRMMKHRNIMLYNCLEAFDEALLSASEIHRISIYLAISEEDILRSRNRWISRSLLSMCLESTGILWHGLKTISFKPDKCE